MTNLPLRPPAVLARSVASLDLLSGGRVEPRPRRGGVLGCHRGDGRPAADPRPGRRALEEAIEVIRPLWDAETRGGVRVDGEYYRVVGAKRGPGAGPRGRRSGWARTSRGCSGSPGGGPTAGCPRWATSSPVTWPRATRSSTTPRSEAGRSPRDVRRLLNIAGEFAGRRARPPERARRAVGRGAGRARAGRRASAPSSWAATTRTTCAASPARSRPPSASWSRPNGPGRGSGAYAGTPEPEPTARAAGPGEPRHRDRRYLRRGADPGRRRTASERQVWDESTRPTGPAPDPERTYTPHEQATGQHLVQSTTACAPSWPRFTT